MDDKRLYELLHKMSEDIGHLKGTSEATLEQATRTNGRLLVAEREIDHLNAFKTQIKTTIKNYIAVGGIIITFLSTIISRII